VLEPFFTASLLRSHFLFPFIAEVECYHVVLLILAMNDAKIIGPDEVTAQNVDIFEMRGWRRHLNIVCPPRNFSPNRVSALRLETEALQYLELSQLLGILRIDRYVEQLTWFET
jgi:hypothetical protein